VAAALQAFDRMRLVKADAEESSGGSRSGVKPTRGIGGLVDYAKAKPHILHGLEPIGG
jgi:hypothetical protein